MFDNKRSAGILMGVSSLPSDFGIGDFGSNAFKFVDLISGAGFKIWQLLPLNPLGAGESPYSSDCGNAIDMLYIDLYELEELGLIKKPAKFNDRRAKVDFDEVRAYKNSVLRKAFEKQKDLTKPEFKKFVKDNPWLKNYALFSVLVKKNNQTMWNTWPEEERFAAYNAKFDDSEYKTELNFIYWTQFVAFRQFFKLKEYANKKKISLVGDIPFYIGAQSSDAWSNQDELMLDERQQPTGVAGVPPDYFSKVGQRWGNYLYDWDYMRENGYKFWLNRVLSMSKMYDVIRIDHFRAFDSYWNINPDCDTAIDGIWEYPNCHALFDELTQKHPELRLVAEDLGTLTPAVYELRDKYELPGMNVLEFTIFDDSFKVFENQIIYTGTHDNDTVLGWLKTLDDNQKLDLDYRLKCGGAVGKSLRTKMLDYCFKSMCRYCIIPTQDIIGLGSEARMNIPGELNDTNWRFKLRDFKDFEKALPLVKEMIANSGR